RPIGWPGPRRVCRRSRTSSWSPRSRMPRRELGTATATGPAGEGIQELPIVVGTDSSQDPDCEVTMFTEFRDRAEGGRLLAEKLPDVAGRSGLLVLALPRGGVPVGFEVARALEAPLDVFVVRKLGVPGDEELAMGAIASGGARALNDEVIQALDIPDRIIRA